MARKARMSLMVVCALGLSACQWQEQNNSLPGAAMSKMDPMRLAAAMPEPDPSFLPLTHFAAGQVLEQRGNYVQAAGQYRRAVVLNHEFIAAYNRLGLVLCRLGRPAEAEQTLRLAIEKRPDRAYLRNNLAYSLMLQENWSAAEVELIMTLQLKPDFTRARVNLGICLGKQGHHEEAMDQFSEALAAEEAFYNLGMICKSNDEYQRAEQAFRRALELNPRFAAAARQLEKVLVGQRHQALAAAAQAVETNAPVQVSEAPEADLAPAEPAEITLTEALPELQQPTADPDVLALVDTELSDVAPAADVATDFMLAEATEHSDPVQQRSDEQPWPQWFEPITPPQLTDAELLNQLWMPSWLAGPSLPPTAVREPTVAAETAPPAVTIDAVNANWLGRILVWLSGLWDRLLALWTAPPVLEPTELAVTPPAEMIAPDLSAGPWWFDYPDPWQRPFDGTWLALAEPEPAAARPESAEDWITVFHWALLDPADEEHVIEWLTRQQ